MSGRPRRRPTIDQVFAELERLEVRARELATKDGSRGSLAHAMRLWCDGARHALAWAVGERGRDKFAELLEPDARAAYRLAAHVEQAPSVALELLEVALRPRRRTINKGRHGHT